MSKALITGASSGLGEALARHYAAQGAILGLVGRRGDKLADLAATLPHPHAVHCYAVDVRDALALRAAAGDWEGAVGEYSEALQSIPSDAQTNNALGYAQLRAGHGDAAIETLRRARELAPADPVIRNNLLLALAVSGRKEEADTLLARSGTPAFAADLRKQVSDEAARLAKVDAAHQEGRP